MTHLPSNWNGVSFLYDADWTSTLDIELFTDASEKGFGCYFQGQWCQGTFPQQVFKDQQMSINWHELYAVTMALALWGPWLKGKHLLFHCNNALVVHIMAKASTCSKTMMALICTFMLLAMWHNVQVHIQHIARVCNDIADIYCVLKWRGFNSSACMWSQIHFLQSKSGSTKGPMPLMPQG